MKIHAHLTPAALVPKLRRLFDLSAAKIRSIEKTWAPSQGSPVSTVGGRYTSRGWTEWTQGFQFGAAILQFDATGDAEFLEIGRSGTVAAMAPHLTHSGVHDHGFNNLSTYGNLLRLMREGRIPENDWERRFYELALKCSGAVQAMRWSRTRGWRRLHLFLQRAALAVRRYHPLGALAGGRPTSLGHVLMGEGDRRISLLDRALDHLRATARYSVYYGEGRDAYDVRGRVAHESIFNPNDGRYRCPNSQQGYSPFTTWTRGLAWAMCGFAEELEYFRAAEAPADALAMLEAAARATCDFYIETTPADGIPYWDTGAPGIAEGAEPLDSSAASIAAQGLLRLGRALGEARYWQAGLSICDSLFDAPYLSQDAAHQGLILHSVYHRPNGWNCEPGESSMWGDYHAREVALYLLRVAEDKPYLKFWM